MGEAVKVCKSDGGKETRKAARESSNVNFPWTFPGVTIKPLVLLKLESKTCD